MNGRTKKAVKRKNEQHTKTIACGSRDSIGREFSLRLGGSCGLLLLGILAAQDAATRRVQHPSLLSCLEGTAFVTHSLSSVSD